MIFSPKVKVQLEVVLSVLIQARFRYIAHLLLYHSVLPAEVSVTVGYGLWGWLASRLMGYPSRCMCSTVLAELLTVAILICLHCWTQLCSYSVQRTVEMFIWISRSAMQMLLCSISIKYMPNAIFCQISVHCWYNSGFIMRSASLVSPHDIRTEVNKCHMYLLEWCITWVMSWYFSFSSN